MYNYESRINRRIERLERTVNQLMFLLIIAFVCMFSMAVTIATRLL